MDFKDVKHDISQVLKVMRELSKEEAIRGDAPRLNRKGNMRIMLEGTVS